MHMYRLHVNSKIDFTNPYVVRITKMSQGEYGLLIRKIHSAVKTTWGHSRYTPGTEAQYLCFSNEIDAMAVLLRLKYPYTRQYILPKSVLFTLHEYR